MRNSASTNRQVVAGTIAVLALVLFVQGCSSEAEKAGKPQPASPETPEVEKPQLAPPQYPPGVDREITLDLGGGVTMELVLIPAGEFRMGDADGYDYEKPVHKVTITKAFYLGKYEVTQEQWEAVMGGNHGHFSVDRRISQGIHSWPRCRRL